MDVTCAILAGGKSRRMGRDKATLKLGDGLLISHVYNIARNVFSRIIIISSRHRSFAGIDAPVLPDVVPSRSAMAGIVSALIHADTPYVFVVPCDMPNLSVDAIQYVLGEARGGEDIIIPRTEYGFEPLHALYNRSCISYFLTAIGKGWPKISDTFRYLSVRVLGDHPSFLHKGRSVFANINTEKDLSIISDVNGNELRSIRKMENQDLGQVLIIERQSFHSPWSKRLFEETLLSPIGTNLVITKGHHVVGYLCLYTVEDEAHILNIAVHPAYTGKGLASALVAHVIDTLGSQGITQFFLEVREGNDGAIRLYKKYGFMVVGKRKKYYTDTNEDALVMRLAAGNS
jgi:ribosomal-protein-alanine acetyltransferase